MDCRLFSSFQHPRKRGPIAAEYTLCVDGECDVSHGKILAVIKSGCRYCRKGEDMCLCGNLGEA